jgi:hypothetical protein
MTEQPSGRLVLRLVEFIVGGLMQTAAEYFPRPSRRKGVRPSELELADRTTVLYNVIGKGMGNRVRPFGDRAPLTDPRLTERKGERP